jgi:metal-responsive CopG/Arc/MetJ family transcriptional regulator
MKRTQIQLTAEQAEYLEEIAEKEGVSKAEIIRRALDRWVLEKGPLGENQRWEQSMEAIGCLDDAGDVSVEHDQYLKDAYDK